MRKAKKAANAAYLYITGKGTRVVCALFFAIFVLGFASISIYARVAHAATNSTINFQARVMTATGAVVADGPISVEFKIYNVASSGTSEWNDTFNLTAKNGYITTSLGSGVPFAPTIDWSQEHWLTMNINGDGEMGPSRMKMTAVPYSFRSGQADSLTNGSGAISASQLAQLAPGSVQGVNSANTALRINQTGAGDLLQLQSANADKFTVNNAGDTSVGGSLAVTNGITVGNSTSTTAGTIRWTGTAFEGYNGSAWTSLGGGLALSSGATASFVSGLANVAGTTTGAVVEPLVFTSATAVSNVAGATGYTAPAAGSFRTCLIKNNAAITAGTLNLRWRVNGVSVGAGACTMNATTSRQSASSLDSGVVTFNAGDTIGLAFDTVGLLPAATNDFTVYWSVEYSSSSSSLTMQKVYDSSAAPVNVITSNNKDVKYTLSNTTTDSNFLVNIASGSTSKFAIQNNGTDTFVVNNTGVSITGLTVTTGGASITGGINNNSGGITNAGIISGTGDITGIGALTLASGGGGDLTLDSSSGVVSLLDPTLRRLGAGTTSLELNDVGNTTLNIINTDATAVANLAIEGLVTANSFSGSGSGLTSLNATNIGSGTLDDLRLSSNVTLKGNSFNGNNNLVLLDGAGALPALNGSALTSLNANNVSSGTINDLRLSSNVTIKGNAFNGVSELVLLDGTGALPALNGAALTNLNATNIISGTINDLRLSGNVTLLGNNFNGNSQLVKLDGSGALPAISGLALTSLNATNISSGTLDDLRLSSNVTLKGNTFNGNDQLVLLNGSGALPALNAGALTSLNATNISSGTLDDLRLSTNVTIMGNTFNGNNQLIKLTGTGAIPALNGAALTNLNATNVGSGTLGDGYLSTNITRLGTPQSFTAQQTFASNIIVGTDTASPQAGLIGFHDATGSNGFTAVLGTNNLTNNRNISLPDEDGTLCIRNSTACGFVLLSSGTAQIDNTNNASIFINKGAAASGNLITLQKNGTTVYSVLNSGALQLALTDASAFTINGAGGTTQFFDVDTTGTGLVKIGGASLDSNATLLVLDTKNTVGDPASQDGAMYYNSKTGTFRCSENARGWTDCLGVSKPNTRRTSSILANGTTTAFGVMGDVGTIAATTTTAAAATTTEPGTINLATANASGSVASVSGNANYNSSSYPGYQSYINLNGGVATMRVWAGLTNQTPAVMGASANPAGSYAAFRYDTGAGDATWKCITKDGTTQNIQDSGIAPTTAGVKLEVIIGNGTVDFKINGSEVCGNVTNLPPANTLLRYVNSLTNVANGIDNLRVGWVYVESER